MEQNCSVLARWKVSALAVKGKLKFGSRPDSSSGKWVTHLWTLNFSYWCGCCTGAAVGCQLVAAKIILFFGLATVMECLFSLWAIRSSNYTCLSISCSLSLPWRSSAALPEAVVVVGRTGLCCGLRLVIWKTHHDACHGCSDID